MSFSTLGLTPELLRAVADEGYLEPTPVQREAIPVVLSGRDLLAAAQTGTGKTAAFVLPILHLLRATGAPARVPASPGGRPVRRPIRVLVVAPTRELALQVEESVRTYGAHLPARSTTIYGGVGFEPQARSLRAGPEIVVATPGRLLDHAGQKTLDLSAVEILVLDEADRLLDMGFIRDIRRIVELLPRARQNLLFSATFSDEVRELAAGLLRNPATVEMAARNAPPTLVAQLVLRVDRDRKRALLSHLVRSGRIDQALVFTRTKHGANRLAEQLVRDGVDATAIHGNKSQSRRVRSLGDFKTGRVSVLVATDLAARGLDIESLPHVVNYELPMVASDYVHRIGRTGRAGTPGEAISLVCVDEAKLLREIEVLLGHWIPSQVIPGFEPDRTAVPEPIRLRSGEANRGRREPAGEVNRGVATRSGGAVHGGSGRGLPIGAAPAPAAGRHRNGQGPGRGTSGHSDSSPVRGHVRAPTDLGTVRGHPPGRAGTSSGAPRPHHAGGPAGGNPGAFGGRPIRGAEAPRPGRPAVRSSQVAMPRHVALPGERFARHDSRPHPPSSER
jgi:ATP-dependent RNA helicase RhlE